MVCPKSDEGMGFRDLRGFNMALLVKQLWNLHHRSETLIGRIMKAKYYKNASALAVIDHNPSFMWRSLMNAQNLVCWWIGNGASVRIWSDKWVPSLPDFYIPSAPSGLPLDAKVRDLIDPKTDDWNHALVESCFAVDIATAIQQIPLR
ncbi:Uncharacterized mitochondrial protein AtMg00310 [Linum grandiflorum]